MILVIIDVNSEPDCLQDSRAQGIRYENLDPACRRETKKVLSDQQYGYCAYCEQRFSSDVFIEHFIPQTDDIARELDFTNLFGVCSGKDYISKMSGTHVPHCGNQKSNNTMELDPRNTEHLERIYYDENAAIRSKDETHNKELDEMLNLNFTSLKEKRNNSFKRHFSNLLEVNRSLKLPKEAFFTKAKDVVTNKRESEFSAYLLFKYNEFQGNT